LRSAYRTRDRARTSTGLPRSARVSYDRGGCPLYPEDGGAPPGQVVSLTGACRSTAASPCTPLHIPSCGASLHEASTGVQAIHPSGIPLACGRPDGTGRPWAFPRASHPADQEPTTHAEVGTGHRARARTTRSTSHQSILQSCSSLTTCDLASHDELRACRVTIGSRSLPSAMQECSRRISARPVFVRCERFGFDHQHARSHANAEARVQRGPGPGGSASHYGTEGQRFESSRARRKGPGSLCLFVFSRNCWV
jgi:hypothetical protein